MIWTGPQVHQLQGVQYHLRRLDHPHGGIEVDYRAEEQ